MTDLVINLSIGKGTWISAKRVILEKEWEKIIIITNDFGKENFAPEKEVEMIIVDQRASIKELITTIESQLKGKIKNDVALNLVSGTGKEHMAIISALLKLGVGIRLVALTKEGIEEVSS